MKQRTTDLIALAGVLGIAAALGFAWRHSTEFQRRHATSTKITDGGGGATPAVGAPAPTPPPPVVAQPPHPPKMCSHPVQTHDRKGSTMLVWEPCSATVDHWGACEPGEQRWMGSRSYAEDSALDAVLRAQVENDYLFGLTIRALEAAECAARRWRLEVR